MKFSVIIPAYCAEKTIENTVKSILKSGLSDLEIIIVDDGSKDNTPAICDGISAECKNVVCIHQKNAGVSAARNRGLAEARGEYVWFFDADDSVDENSMADAAKIIEDRAPDMLIFGMSFDLYRNGTMYRRDELVYTTEQMYTRETVTPVMEELYKCNALSSSCNKLIKRKVLTDNGVYYNSSLTIMEDYLFVLNALKACNSIYTLPKVIYRYIQISQNEGAEDRVSRRLESIPSLEAYLKPFENALADKPGMFVSLYYMLLGQKLRKEKPKAIAKTAESFVKGPYSNDYYCSFCNDAEKKLASMLKEEKCFKIYLRNLKSRLRHRIAILVKSTRIYLKIRG